MHVVTNLCVGVYRADCAMAQHLLFARKLALVADLRALFPLQLVRRAGLKVAFSVTAT